MPLGRAERAWYCVFSVTALLISDRNTIIAGRRRHESNSEQAAVGRIAESVNRSPCPAPVFPNEPRSVASVKDSGVRSRSRARRYRRNRRLQPARLGFKGYVSGAAARRGTNHRANEQTNRRTIPPFCHSAYWTGAAMSRGYSKTRYSLAYAAATCFFTNSRSVAIAASSSLGSYSICRDMGPVKPDFAKRRKTSDQVTIP